MVEVLTLLTVQTFSVVVTHAVTVNLKTQDKNISLIFSCRDQNYKTPLTITKKKQLIFITMSRFQDLI